MSQNIKEILDRLKVLNVDISLTNKDTLQLHIDQNNELPPTMVQEIKQYKDEIITYLKQIKVQVSSHIPFASPQENYSVSYAQKRFWLLSQIEENSVAYNIPIYVSLGPQYNIDAFKNAVYGLIKKYEILRTVFKLDSNCNIRQWIVPFNAFNFSINEHDFRGAIDRQLKVQEFIRAKFQEKFDMENGPLLRANLIRIGENEYVFSCILHHIISDGWSRKIITKDIEELYTFYRKNNTLPNFTETIQYKDYASWQCEQIASGGLDFQKQYWIQKLSGEIPLLTFTSPYVRPHIASNNGVLVSTYIASGSTKKLKKFCEQQRGSLFMGLMAIWRILIYRYTSQKDVIIGTPTAGRNHIDIEHQLGCFINTLALRQTINPTDNFYTLFKNTKTEILNAFAHQDYPFDKLVEDLKLPREISRNPLFDVMVTLQNNEQIDIVSKGNTVNNHDIVDEGKMASKLDLDINFQEVGDYLSFSIIYNTDVYHKELINNLILHFKSLVNEVLYNPNEEVGKVHFLTENERYELIKTLNNTIPQYTLDKHIIELFQKFVIQTPEKVALLTTGKNYTYKELDTISNSLANFLLSEQEVLNGDFVGVLLPRDEWLLISMITIFKLGAVYVPIDVEYPEERIEYILNNTECSLVINNELIKRFKTQQATITTVFLNRPSRQEDVAYVIHTSGSTGKPKAAMITHEGMMNHLRIMEQELELNTESIVVQNAAATFDISIWQLINALITGGSTSIYDTNAIINPSLFLERMDSEKANILQVVPGYLTILLNLEASEKIKYLGGLKYLLVTGEAVQKSLIKMWLDLYPDIPVVNAYGPAEAADDVTLHIMQKVPETSQVPIGHTVANMAIYIVDEKEQLCPKDVIGEIWVAGIGVGKGYYNANEKTQESFVTNPFDGSKPKLYKTGDLGYWSAQGELHFIGRKDNQIKLRGYRIELGEIEYALAQNKQLNEIAVITKKDHEYKDLLIAYYTANKDIKSEVIKNELKLSIPDYMIPGVIIRLEKLPLTPNGKVDRKALALLEYEGATNKKAFESPKNTIEAQLLEIWKELLHLEVISINDNFFELGGDSLLAIKIKLRINQVFEINISMISIFEYPSISELALYIRYFRIENTEMDIDKDFELIEL